jgi:hypothetical protein
LTAVIHKIGAICRSKFQEQTASLRPQSRLPQYTIPVPHLAPWPIFVSLRCFWTRRPKISCHCAAKLRYCAGDEFCNTKITLLLHSCFLLCC